MWQDKIVAEVREARKAHAAKFNYDLGLIYQDLKHQEQQSKRKVVSFPSKAPLPARANEVTVTSNT